MSRAKSQQLIKTVHENVVGLMTLKKMTSNDVFLNSGKEGSVYNIIREPLNCTISTLDDVARGLGVSIGDLFDPDLLERIKGEEVEREKKALEQRIAMDRARLRSLSNNTGSGLHVQAV